ncbi:MAG: PilW family protein [Xanthomonadales bacterium]|jgi:type IV pilus assembly protein PilW|nr:PilW family protein [Xanthomonadales bacterium]
MRGQLGVSLIELLVALAIGALLLLGLAQVFQATNVSAQMGTALSRVQENGRFALDFMRADIRMAGHMGCTSGAAMVRDIDLAPTQLQSAMQIGGSNISFSEPPLIGTVAPPFIYDFRYDVQGYEASETASNPAAPTPVTLALPPTVGGANQWTPALPGELLGLTPRPIAGSDIVVVRHGLPGEMNITGGFTTGAAANPVVAITNGLIADSGLTFAGVNRVGVPFVAASCTGNTQGLVFIATSIVANAGSMTITGNNTFNWPVLAAEGLNTTTEGGSTLTRLDFVAYYVGLNPNNIPSLYRASFGAAAVGLAPLVSEEIVEGVDSLQIHYGFELGPAPPAPPPGTPPRPQSSSDLSSRVDAYATAAEIHAGDGPVTPLSTRSIVERWRRVVSVRVGVLARSTSRISGEGTAVLGPYDVNGVRFSLGNQDALMRQGYEEVITIRNRLRNLNTN